MTVVNRSDGKSLTGAGSMAHAEQQSNNMNPFGDISSTRRKIHDFYLTLKGRENRMAKERGP